MIGLKAIDKDREVDWGKTSIDYATYRPGPPKSYYRKLKALDIGLRGQKILDLGTGTGFLPLEFAKSGCIVTGSDISQDQINMAKSNAQKQGLDISYILSATEDLDFPKRSFDIITANQCFLYFDQAKVIPLIKKFLKPDGVLVTTHFSWMPFLSPIAKASEELILKYNPQWTGHSYKGDINPGYPGLGHDFRVKGFFCYDEGIEFDRESWRGRIRASRGIGASLTQDEVQRFDNEHKVLLNKITSERFKIIHRIDAHIMTPLN